MKQKFNQCKISIGEMMVGGLLVNGFGLFITGSVPIAIFIQLIYLFVSDLCLRKHLIKSKRKFSWNIGGIGSLKSLAIVATVLHEPLIALCLTIFCTVATRIMFCEDKDRTVLTVEELKEAYFIPTIKKGWNKIINGWKSLYKRVRYVLTN